MFVNSVFQKGNFWQNNADNKVFFLWGWDGDAHHIQKCMAEGRL